MHKTTKIALAMGAVLLAGAAGVATYSAAEARGGWHARDHGRHHGDFKRGRGLVRLMDRYDANADDKLTQEELDQARRDLVAKHDADGNGTLTLAEYEKLWLDVMRKRMVRSFQRIDEDGSAEVTVDEFVKPLGKVVKRLDRNEDGALDRTDFRRRVHRDGDRGDRRG